MQDDLWKFLNIASSFDLITPLVAFIQDLANGPPAYFGIAPDAGWSIDDIHRLLTGHGVKVWGLMLSVEGEALMFTVQKSQARRAYYLLQRAGAPILYAPDEVIRS